MIRARKNIDAMIRAVQPFLGRRKITEAYSDDAPQFDKIIFPWQALDNAHC